MPTETTTIRPPSDRLTTQDASFIYGESFAGPLHIGSLSIFEGEIAFEKMRDALAAKLPLIKRYRQRLHFVPFNIAHATWEDDPAFDVSNHVKRHVLPRGTSLEGGVAAAISVHEAMLVRTRPLWEVHSFEGVEDRTIVLLKVHHCLVDGISGIDLMTVMFDFQADAAPPDVEDSWSPKGLPTPLDAVMNAMRDNFEAQTTVARQAAERFLSPDGMAKEAAAVTDASRKLAETMLKPIVGAPWNTSGIVTSARSFAWNEFPFSAFRAIRGPLGGTVNDIVLTILGEAVARYFAESGVSLAGADMMRMGCPVSMRGGDESGALGNRVSMMFPSLPARPMKPSERLTLVQRETSRIKEGREAQSLELLMQATDWMPATLQGMTSLISMTTVDALASLASWAPVPSARPFMPFPVFGINFVATNVPGVQVPQYLAGHLMLHTLPLVPLAGTLGFGVAIQSYNQNLYFGMMAEPRMLPDVWRIKAHADDVFGELLVEAGLDIPPD